MTHDTIEWLRKIRREQPFAPGSILEVGSYTGFPINPRSIFPDAKEYVGIDMRPGTWVDLVARVEELPPTFVFDTILMLDCLEHDPDPVRTIREVHKRLGRHLFITLPDITLPEHRHPKDYWRFHPDAITDIFFNGLEIVDLQKFDHPPKPDPGVQGPGICVYGRKP